jgi:hypothetical protein
MIVKPNLKGKTRKEILFDGVKEKAEKERKEYVEGTNLDELNKEGKLAYEASLLVFDDFILKVMVPENMELTGKRFVTITVSKDEVNALFNKMYDKINKAAVRNFVHKMHHLYFEEFNGQTNVIDVGTGSKFESITYKLVIE